MGLGMLSALAKMGAAPEASSKNATKIILTIVFFMFFSCGELAVQFMGRSIAFACRPGRTK